MTEAYTTNWMSTVGQNINEVERIAAEKAGVKYAVGLCSCTAALHLCVKLAGERLYGKPDIGHGAVEGMTGEFPVLRPGATAISWSGSVTKVVIQPKWRCI